MSTANNYSTMISRLVSELSAGLASASYTGVVVQSGLFRPAALPTFTRYAAIVSPNVKPWDEERHAMLAIAYWFRADIYLLVKRYDETTNPLFGVSSPDLGLFQMIEDTKSLLRSNTLSGLLDKTYDEPAGDASKLGGGGMEFGELASPAFDSAEHAFVYRAKMPYKARMKSFCHAK